MTERSDMTYQYTYSASVNKEVEDIRKKYMPHEENKMEELKRLDNKVQHAGRIEALSIGIVGCLIFGLAMCIGLESMGGGSILAVIVGIVGVAVMIPAYPVCLRISRKAKEKYTPRILQLADEIQGGQPEEKIGVDGYTV